MKKVTTEQLYGASATLVVHLLLFLLLWFLVIDRPQPQDEQGVPVILGNTALASGDSYEYTEVAVASPAPTAVSAPEPVVAPDEPLLTQPDEPTVVLNSSNKKKNKQTKKEQKTAEQLEAERKRQEAERVRREAEELARITNARIAGAFGKGNTMSGKGDAPVGKGVQGSLQGNAQSGALIGVGGYGTFDLGGRSLSGTLPRPAYNVQDEGRVVVTITVNPEGRVIHTSINSRTNTANASLRRAALNAASQARFNEVSAMNNQTGTITYYFKLR